MCAPALQQRHRDAANDDDHVAVVNPFLDL